MNDIMSPVFAMWLLTFVVWVYMYYKRIPWITSSELTDEQMKPAVFAELQPPDVANPSDNLKNLFELPILFYGICLYLHFAGLADGIYVISAWIFVLFRLLHSIMHCTKNVVIVRFGLYAVSAAACFFMIFRAAFSHFA